MEMPAGSAVTLDRPAAMVGPSATTAGAVLVRHGGEAHHASRSPDVVVFSETTQAVRPSPDLRA
jgi:hypothetical protein